MKKSERRPLIFDIHHFALDDGPGIRTTVYFKGCPLACKWCQNPESIYSGRDISFNSKLCIQCGDCQFVCPEKAICLDKTNRIEWTKCNACGKCVEVCPTTALKCVGTFYKINTLLEILKRDRIFYETSKGGVTFSGGEPTLCMDYVRYLMERLKKNDIHITIQTSGMFDISDFKKKLLPYISLIFYDIKFIAPELHKKYTGKENQQILDNFLELVKDSSKEIIPRVPLVPNITATPKNLSQIANFLRNAGCKEYQLLPYNPGWVNKRILMGKPIPPDISQSTFKENEMEKLVSLFQTFFSG